MHSNGVGHLGNDTFIAATRDRTGDIFLVTGNVVQERVTALPLTRHVRFNLYGDTTHPDHQTATTSLKDEFRRVQHSFHPSVDGKHVAVISTGGSKHYLIDVLNTQICEFATQEPVISVVWHPTNTTRLMLLLATGVLLSFRTDVVKLHVAFENVEKVQLGVALMNFKDYILGRGSAAITSELEVPCGRRHTPLLPQTLKMERTLTTLTGEPEEKPVAMITDGGMENLSSLSSSEERIADQWSDVSDSNESSGNGGKKGEEVAALQRKTGKENGAVVVAETTNNDEKSALWKGGTSCISEKGSEALVGACIIPASLSLPVMLLTLSRDGDIFSVKVNANGIPTSLGKEFDGRVETLHGKKGTEIPDEQPFPCVHYLVRGVVAAAGYVEEPLAISSAMVDEDVGRHVVFVLYNSGVLRGEWFSEPDLLCRNLMRDQMKLVIYLDAAFSPKSLLPTSTADVPALYSISVQTCGNTSLIRYNNSAFLCVWPMWSRGALGWVYRSEGMDACQRIPVAGRGAEIPEPIALRLPYDVSEASIGVGVNDILIFPTVSKLGQSFAQSKVVIVKIATLVLTALFASGEKYRLTFGAVAAALDNNVSDKKEVGGQESWQQHHHHLEKLLELTSTCCQQWLCGYPHEIIDESTANLAIGVEGTHRKLKARQKMLQERKGHLAERVSELTRRQQELSRDISRSQSIVRGAMLHRSGVKSFYAANEKLGKIHVLLKEMEDLVVQRRGLNEQKTTVGIL